MKKKYISNYREMAAFTTKDSCSFPIFQVQGKNSTWIFKKSNNVSDEVLIQEFLRLMLPHQPKTRVVYDDNNVVVGLLSKKVEQFQSLGQIDIFVLFYKMLTGKITDLGGIVVLLLFICERDAKLAGNVGINRNHQITKVDGNETMLALPDDTLEQRYPISEQDIANLPLAPHYAITNINWLSQPNQGQSADLRWYLWLLMSYNKNFRRELNSMLLKLILTPDHVIEKLVEHYSLRSPQDKQQCKNQFKQRKQLFREKSVNVSSFSFFVKSKESEKALRNFVKDIASFKLQGGEKFINSSYQEMIDQYNKLKQLPSRYALPIGFNGIFIIVFFVVLIAFISKLMTPSMEPRKMVLR